MTVEVRPLDDKCNHPVPLLLSGGNPHRLPATPLPLPRYGRRCDPRQRWTGSASDFSLFGGAIMMVRDADLEAA